MKKFDYYQPQTLGEAFDLMEKMGGNGRYVAGGTDLIVRIKQKLIRTDALISLRGIESLKGIRMNGGPSMGSMTLCRDVERSADLKKAWPGLVEAVSLLANPQIRNVATVGGNICNGAPSADCAPPLLVLDAVLVVEGPGGEREVPVAEFFKGPGKTCLAPVEILTRIRLPRSVKGTGMSFVKMGRVTQDIAVANAAALVVMDGRKCRKCRVAAGAVAPVPLRLRKVEKLIEGRAIDAEVLEEAGRLASREVKPITDVRSTEAYRRHLSGVLVKRVLRQAMDRLS
jgi:CO/xanthine dehydrogenase FAD-binding subunit